MATQRGPERLGWFSLALVIVLLLGQFVPYASIAAIAPGPQPMAPSDLPLANQWAQFQPLSNGAIGLANFDPTVNGFQFSNQELVAAINRKGHASAWETVLTEQLQRLFGTQVCVGETGGTCVLTAAAQNWLKTQLERMDLGVAEGMAAAVLALWQPQPQRRPWWQQLINLLLGQTVFSLGRNLFDLQTFIANLFLMQSVPEVFQPTQAIRDRRTPTEILLAISDSFLKGGSHLFTMGIYRRLEGQL
ncbi:MAG: hypothetical protein VKL98_09440, partial [Cyanobacteriota bacterium]|nr:hypothetical protein [Cyanobacteriota bacterium]